MEKKAEKKTEKKAEKKAAPSADGAKANLLPAALALAVLAPGGECVEWLPQYPNRCGQSAAYTSGKR